MQASIAAKEGKAESRSNWPRLWAFAIAVLVGLNAAAATAATPFSVSVHFSRADAEHPWKEDITGFSGKPVYVLTLLPDYAIEHYLVGAMLVLPKVGGQSDDVNLLAPANGHGMQPYVFNALDLRGGIDKSLFGPVRRMNVPEAGLTVTVTLKDVKVSVAPHKTSPGISQCPEIAKMWPAYPQLDDLRFDLLVEPLPGRSESLRSKRAERSDLRGAQDGPNSVRRSR
jgi:hypothetical protein